MNTVTPSSSNCQTIDHIARDSTVILIELSEVILAFLTVGCVIVSRAYQATVYFHSNLKNLIRFYHFSLIAFSLTSGFTQLFHLVSPILFEGCDIPVAVCACAIPRIIISAVNMMYALLMLAIPLERTFATWTVGAYENRDGTLGVICGYFIVLISLAFAIPYNSDDFFSKKSTSNCIYDRFGIVTGATVTTFLILDGASLFLIFALLAYNRYKLTRKTYSLSIEFQLHQNIRVLNLFLPNLLLHTVAYLWYTLGNYYVPSFNLDPLKHRILVMLANCLPLYTFLASLRWLFVVRGERHRRRTCCERVATSRTNEKDLYFQSLQDQWSRQIVRAPARSGGGGIFSVGKAV
ncbi:unnamed protein product [Caenorhabditis auriculariae]|uniref:G protein-coupled receptor n=1 Tax=Caenorhabditis auriculariae TaxID=2777116 RepID=A0A8S1HQ51_9PELO|nr:unnamed protein product [Caenorhabditis auriculariae]